MSRAYRLEQARNRRLMRRARGEDDDDIVMEWGMDHFERKR